MVVQRSMLCFAACDENFLFAKIENAFDLCKKCVQVVHFSSSPRAHHSQFLAVLLTHVTFLYVNPLILRELKSANK